MANSDSPTFILVPGHWHTVTHLEPLVTALQERSQRVKPVQLHSVGRKPAGKRPCFADDVSVIYAATIKELLAGNDVCLVLHSYAGMPGAEAVNRLIIDGALETREDNQQENGPEEIRRLLGGRLVKIVFIAAYIFPAGVVFDPKNSVGPDNPGFRIDDNNMTHMSSPWHFFFNDLPLSLAKPFVDAIGPTYYVGPMKLSSENWRTAPVTALLCKKDNAVPPSRQEGMWKEGESAEKVEWIEACHSPWVSRAAEVAGFLVKAVGQRPSSVEM